MKRTLKKPVAIVLIAMLLTTIAAKNVGFSWADSVVVAGILYLLLFILAYAIYFLMALVTTALEERWKGKCDR